MAQYQTILYQKQRKGVLITLNRPNALNAMNQEMMNELDAALAEAEKDAEIRAVVITGAGGAFSVGEDISGDDGETAWPYGIPANTRSTRPTINSATPTAKISWAANCTAGSIPSRSSARSAAGASARLLARPHLPCDDRRR